jgi:hypothetical protein
MEVEPTGPATYDGPVRDALVDGIELAVGLACVVLAVGAWRTGLRLAGVVAAVAAAAAIAHAGWSILG